MIQRIIFINVNVVKLYVSEESQLMTKGSDAHKIISVPLHTCGQGSLLERFQYAKAASWVNEARVGLHSVTMIICVSPCVCVSVCP